MLAVFGRALGMSKASSARLTSSIKHHLTSVDPQIN